MNIQKFTQKSVEAINNCEKIAYDYGSGTFSVQPDDYRRQPYRKSYRKDEYR